MLALVLLPMMPGVEHNNHENYKPQPQEYYHPRPVFPDHPETIRKLGPIHAFAGYTVFKEKDTPKVFSGCKLT